MNIKFFTISQAKRHLWHIEPILGSIDIIECLIHCVRGPLAILKFLLW
jgi:hypothetical protein